MAFKKSGKIFIFIATFTAIWSFSSPVLSMAQERDSWLSEFKPPEGTVWFVVAPDLVINNLGTNDDSVALQEFMRKAHYSRDQIFPGITKLGLPDIIVKSLDDLTSSHLGDTINWFPDSSGGLIRHFTFTGPNDLDQPWQEICKRTPGQNKWDSDSGHLLDKSQFKGWKRRVSEYSGTVNWEKIMVKHAHDVAQSDMPWAHKLAFLLLDASNSDLETYIIEKSRGPLRKGKKQIEYWFTTFSAGPKGEKIQLSATSFRLRLEKYGVDRDIFTFNAEL